MKRFMLHVNERYHLLYMYIKQSNDKDSTRLLGISIQRLRGDTGNPDKRSRRENGEPSLDFCGESRS